MNSAKFQNNKLGNKVKHSDVCGTIDRVKNRSMSTKPTDEQSKNKRTKIKTFLNFFPLVQTPHNNRHLSNPLELLRSNPGQKRDPNQRGNFFLNLSEI
jgi:hypothetical protein